MRKALKAFISWMDKRFPEKVVVTEDDYQNLKREIGAFKGQLEGAFKLYAAIDEDLKGVKEKVRKLGDDFNAVKVAAGFAPLRAQAGLTR